jgi:hypothetical protein
MMASNGKATALYQHHCYENAGMLSLWFYREFDPEGPEPDDDPDAVRLLGPAPLDECEAAVRVLRLALSKLGLELAEEFTADD